jgi:hypothetical protein
MMNWYGIPIYFPQLNLNKAKLIYCTITAVIGMNNCTAQRQQSNI